MKTVKEEIANNLLFYRKKSKLTQKELADHIGVKNNTISQWENGTNSIDVEVLFNICEVLEVSISDMYGSYSNTSELSLTAEELSIITKFRKLDERGRLSVTRTLEQEYSYIEEQAEFVAERTDYIKNNSLQFAAAGGDSSNLEEAQELYDAKRKGKTDGK